MLTEETRKSIIELQKRYPNKRSALIPALHLAQAEIGYLPRDIQNEVAELFDIDSNEVNAVVTFYDMFFDQPLGKHLIHVCKNLSCMLRGADGVLKKICHRLNVEPHETTADGEFTVIPSECLAACDRAPMVLVDDKVVGPISEQDVEHILEEAKKSPGHPSPVQILEGYHA
ncbi:NADH dehydrogenase [ubiquinone] flavoprotein 2,mitochondrial [Parachlamydia acanthamoebae UV-7]|uniref:NADH dehydrogenase [ubiquinone] flavoprotein 2,mitochondrial n=1 Tax=Parachlamydia acanthamoebae (strain UV7) TaxID=765952 RepID=F8KV84_PARAV|nr:NADH-quinone oxidoreductase subunit NuoE [Parachlamydia acanthamoebae]CCB87606.1 NADH dehydrogenase [ubiquinone] flavoprotein 2,mitochondrial [Parachlamydia acanthamoebae UV-7]